MNITDKTGILGELWINYKDDEAFQEFIRYNDLGLPLSYMVAEGLVTDLTPLGEEYIEETFGLFIASMGIEESDIPDGIDLQELLKMVEEMNEQEG